MSPDADTDAAWLLTARISPRDRVRVASRDASGTVLNQYSRTRPLDQSHPPTAPWAVPLASADGFRLLAFDLDAKTSSATAADDAAALSQLLHDAGIPHLVCRSGPSDGRHLWTATTEPIDSALVATMARLAAALLPSLDIAPLGNAAAGCVRPPGAPHRDGGRSVILEGSVDCLLHPQVSVAEIEQLIRLLAARVSGTIGNPLPAGKSATYTDPQGHPYLPGTRRQLPAASLAALQTTTTGLDASVVLNTVLLGAAASHWHLAEIAELTPTAPGLEHLRSRRGKHKRLSRSARGTAETLARQWRYAVRYVATHPRRVGADDTFDTRAGNFADSIRALQERADASPGRWTRGGGPADRRVLDCLHQLALTALTTTIEADIRRVGLTCGIGRETARTALHRLAADGWISEEAPAAGVHGTTWQIDPRKLLHRDPNTTRSQAATRPEGAGAAERTALLNVLTERNRRSTHDVFTGNHALSLAAGNLYAHLAEHPESSAAAHEVVLLERLAAWQLVTRARGVWIAAEPRNRDGAAQALLVGGRLAAREALYAAERAAWSWWQAEHDWMCRPRARRDRRPRAHQVPLWQASGATLYPAHPRGPTGQADFAAARAAIRDGAVNAIPVLAAA